MTSTHGREVGTTGAWAAGGAACAATTFGRTTSAPSRTFEVITAGSGVGFTLRKIAERSGKERGVRGGCCIGLVGAIVGPFCPDVHGISTHLASFRVTHSGTRAALILLTSFHSRALLILAAVTGSSWIDLGMVKEFGGSRVDLKIRSL